MDTLSHLSLLIIYTSYSSSMREKPLTIKEMSRRMLYQKHIKIDKKKNVNYDFKKKPDSRISSLQCPTFCFLTVSSIISSPLLLKPLLLKCDPRKPLKVLEGFVLTIWSHCTIYKYVSIIPFRTEDSSNNTVQVPWQRGHVMCPWWRLYLMWPSLLW